MGWNETLILWLLKSGRVAITIYLKKCIKARGERSEEKEERIQEVETKHGKSRSAIQPVCHSSTNQTVQTDIKAAIRRNFKMEKAHYFSSGRFIYRTMHCKLAEWSKLGKSAKYAFAR